MPSGRRAGREVRRRSIVSEMLSARPGLVHGQTAMQMAQPWCSAKKGMHLSKSTYHFSTPRTICFSCWIAPGGRLDIVDVQQQMPVGTGAHAAAADLDAEQVIEQCGREVVVQVAEDH